MPSVLSFVARYIAHEFHRLSISFSLLLSLFFNPKECVHCGQLISGPGSNKIPKYSHSNLHD